MKVKILYLFLLNIFFQINIISSNNIKDSNPNIKQKFEQFNNSLNNIAETESGVDPLEYFIVIQLIILQYKKFSNLEYNKKYYLFNDQFIFVTEWGSYFCIKYYKKVNLGSEMSFCVFPQINEDNKCVDLFLIVGNISLDTNNKMEFRIHSSIGDVGPYTIGVLNIDLSCKFLKLIKELYNEEIFLLNNHYHYLHFGIKIGSSSLYDFEEIKQKKEMNLKKKQLSIDKIRFEKFYEKYQKNNKMILTGENLPTILNDINLQSFKDEIEKEFTTQTIALFSDIYKKGEEYVDNNYKDFILNYNPNQENSIKEKLIEILFIKNFFSQENPIIKDMDINKILKEIKNKEVILLNDKKIKIESSYDKIKNSNDIIIFIGKNIYKIYENYENQNKEIIQSLFLVSYEIDQHQNNNIFFKENLSIASDLNEFQSIMKMINKITNNLNILYKSSLLNKQLEIGLDLHFYKNPNSDVDSSFNRDKENLIKNYEDDWALKKLSVINMFNKDNIKINNDGQLIINKDFENNLNKLKRMKNVHVKRSSDNIPLIIMSIIIILSLIILIFLYCYAIISDRTINKK